MLLQVGDTLTATLTVDKCSGSRVSFITCCRKGASGTPGARGGASISTGDGGGSGRSSGGAAGGSGSSSEEGEVVVEGMALALIRQR